MRFGTPFLVAALLSCSITSAAAPDKAAPIQREIIPGSELMTSRERERYRSRMRAAPTAQEQAQAREQHVKQMRARAHLRGLELAGERGKTAP